MDVDARLEVLENENEALRAENKELKAKLLKTDVVPLTFGLTAHEANLFAILMGAQSICSKQYLLNRIYNSADEQPQEKIVDVFVCKARKKLKPYGIEIQTVWGRGYRMTPEMKEAAAKFA